MANATNRWLDKLAAADKAKGGTGSDYKLAQMLGVTSQLMYKYRSGTNDMGPDSALVLAQLLDVHPMIVIGEVQAERARDARMQRLWSDAAKHYGKKAAFAGAVILTASSFAPQGASGSRNGPSPTPGEASPSVYYVKQRRAPAGGEPPRKKPPFPTFKPGRIVHLHAA